MDILIVQWRLYWMNYKLKENMRLNKVCSICIHGSHLMSNESVELCLKDIDTDNDASIISKN